MQSSSDLERMEIDKAVQNLRHRLAEENDIITTVTDPLIEEAVILSKKSMFDEFGILRTPKDPKEIYLKLVDEQKKQTDNDDNKIKKMKIRLDLSKLSSEAQELYSEVLKNRIATISEIAQFPELLQESTDISKGPGLEYQLQN
jgi:hypothetical protein